MSILTICQDAAQELSLVTPSSVVASTDPTAKKLARHLTKTCLALAKRHDWQILRKEHTFTTVQAAQQTGAIPSDFLRFVPGSMYNRTLRRRIMGPMTADEWQARQASDVNTVFQAFVQRGNAILFTPTPPAGEVIAFEYITQNIGTDATGATGRDRFTADSDRPYFNEELLTLGVVASYRQSERLDYAEEFRQFELAISDMLKQDGGRRTLDLDSAQGQRGAFIPDTLEFDFFNSEFSDFFG